MTHAYATANAASALSGTAFTWNTGYTMTTAEKAAVNDGHMDALARSGGAAATPIRFDCDFGAAVDLIGIALLNHNLASLPSSVTVKILADTANTFATAVTAKSASALSTPSLRGLTEKDSLFAFPSVTAKRYWRVEVAWLGGVSQVVTLGEFFPVLAGGFTSLSRQQLYGHGQGLEYITNETKLGNGEVARTFHGGPVATKRFSFSDLTTAQLSEIMLMWHTTKGGSTNLLWSESYTSGASSADTSAERECLFGRLQPSSGWRENDFTLFGPDGLELRNRGREVGS